MSNTITYIIDGKLYINLTNKCSNNCNFCIRNTTDGLAGYYLWLDREPTVQEVVQEIENYNDIDEIIFCGFGEPLMRWKEVIEIAQFAKKKGYKTRINTNGQVDLFSDQDIVPLLAPYIDVISISLNEVTAKDYVEICDPQYGELAYYKILDFAKRCSKEIKKVVLTVVDVIGEEKIAKAKMLSDNLGVNLRVRRYKE